jgi:hypothetical protein
MSGDMNRPHASGIDRDFHQTAEGAIHPEMAAWAAHPEYESTLLRLTALDPHRRAFAATEIIGGLQRRMTEGNGDSNIAVVLALEHAGFAPEGPDAVLDEPYKAMH